MKPAILALKLGLTDVFDDIFNLKDQLEDNVKDTVKRLLKMAGDPSIKGDVAKELLKEIVPLVDRIVVSFATKSLISKRKFHAERKWLTDFIKEEFKVLDDFEFGNEKYLVFTRK